MLTSRIVHRKRSANIVVVEAELCFAVDDVGPVVKHAASSIVLGNVVVLHGDALRAGAVNAKIAKSAVFQAWSCSCVDSRDTQIVAFLPAVKISVGVEFDAFVVRQSIVTISLGAVLHLRTNE